MDNKGYIRLSRKFFKNKYWLKERTYNQAEAWLDLIQMARFEAEPLNKVLPRGRQIVIERGEIHSSLRFLSARWGWGIMQVRVFLRSCVASQQITQRMAQGESIITLCKYEDYNPLSGDNTPDNTPDSTPETPVTICERDGYNPLLSEGNTLDNTPDNTPEKKVTHRQHTDNTNLNKGKKVKKEKKESISNEICRDAPDAVPVSALFKKFVGDFNGIRESKFQAIEKVGRSFNARLKEGFTPDQMLQVLKTAMKEKNHIESGYKYLTPEFITRPDKLERFLNSAPPKGLETAPRLGAGEWIRPDGRRTYGSGSTAVPDDAPPRPSAAWWWNDGLKQWNL